MSVRNALLALISQRPRHGYELLLAFTAVVGSETAWDLKPAQVYTTLTRLEEAGLIAAQDAVDAGLEKRVFGLTDAGRLALIEWFGAGVSEDHRRDEFYVKLMVSLATGTANPYRVIQVQRAALYRDLHALTAERADANPKRDLARVLLLDKVIMHLEADIRWLDMIETRLDDVRRQPRPEPDPRPRGRPRKQIDIS
jgi:DNA-binding PadR family transcriptional regulator